MQEELDRPVHLKRDSLLLSLPKLPYRSKLDRRGRVGQCSELGGRGRIAGLTGSLAGLWAGRGAAVAEDVSAAPAVVLAGDGPEHRRAADAGRPLSIRDPVRRLGSPAGQHSDARDRRDGDGPAGQHRCSGSASSCGRQHGELRAARMC